MILSLSVCPSCPRQDCDQYCRWARRTLCHILIIPVIVHDRKTAAGRWPRRRGELLGAWSHWAPVAGRSRR